MWPKQINISKEKVLQVTEVIEQENPFRIHVNKEKLVNISSGVTLDDDIAESIPKRYGSVDIIADSYKTKSIKSSKQWGMRKWGNIHIALLLPKVPSDFHRRILRNFDSKNDLLNSYLSILKKKQNIV